MNPIWSNDSPRRATPRRTRSEAGCAPPRSRSALWSLLAMSCTLAPGCGTDSGSPTAPPPPPLQPATVAVNAGDTQTATVGTAVPTPPSVRISTADGTPVPGVSVRFEVVEGGGSVTGSPALSDAAGVAAVERWTLGTSPGRNELRATVGSATAVSFEAVATQIAPANATSGYDIVIRFNAGSDPTTEQRQAFDAAEARWEEVIIGDLPDVTVNRPTGTCSSTSPIDETVDDLLIFITFEAIDGPGGVLGSGGPCMIRSGSTLPLAGSIRFDTADLGGLESSDLLEEVVLHEMGHVIGVGSLWNLFGFLADPAQTGGLDPHFTGPLAINAFNAGGGSGHPGAKVPVEDAGGSGTADAHWREAIFDREVMTGWIDAGANPLSSVTVSSLADHGYATDPASADPLSLSFSPTWVPRLGASASALQMVDDMTRGPIEVVDTRGRTERVLPD